MSRLAALVSLELTRTRRRRGSSVAAIALLVVVALTTIARRVGGASAEDVLDQGAYGWLVRVFALLFGYVFAAGNLGEELAQRTLVYLTSRPLPRPGIIVAKWLVATATCALLLFSAALLLVLFCGLDAPGGALAALALALRVGFAASLEAGVCAAIGMTYGALLPQASGALALLHLAWFELGGSFAPGRLRLLSMAHHAAELAGLPRRGFMTEAVPSLPALVHAAVLVIGCAAWLFAAALVFSLREYRGSEGD